jgi:hypothetical protein
MSSEIFEVFSFAGQLLIRTIGEEMSGLQHDSTDEAETLSLVRQGREKILYDFAII